ncbi:MAG: hypothetical protein V2A79_16245 [Planctomycetota bacterium]
MRRIGRLLHGAVIRLVLVATAGVMLQTSGCGITPSGLTSDMTTAFINTLITSYVNDQLGVTSGLFF